jgi:4a-hydroxytetrahydrobiopterin dehydratase
MTRGLAVAAAVAVASRPVPRPRDPLEHLALLLSRDRGGAVSRLDETEITRRLAALAGWERRGDEICRSFAFSDFKAALAFVNRVGELAEAANHHPDIDIRYSRVTLVLTTHDAGGLTARDFELAASIGG